MPCTAPSRNNMRVQGPCGYETYQANLCKPHWQMANGFALSQIDQATVLLLHCDGADAATAFADSSPTSKAVTAFGNAQVDTAQSKFGGASVLFDGTTDYLSVPDSPDFAFGSGDFTIDFWVRPNSIVGGHYPLSKLVGGLGPFAFFQSDAFLYFYAGTGAAWDIANGLWLGTLVASQWQHVAVVRQGNTISCYLNGVVLPQGIVTSMLALGGAVGAPLIIGAGPGGGTAYDGWMDEFRISRVARWTAPFNVPTAPYT